MTYSCGNVYQYCDSYYVLAQVSPHKVSLISLQNFANRWTEPTEVYDVDRLNQEEWLSCLGSLCYEPEQFKYVGKISEFSKAFNIVQKIKKLI